MISSGYDREGRGEVGLIVAPNRLIGIVKESYVAEKS